MVQDRTMQFGANDDDGDDDGGLRVVGGGRSTKGNQFQDRGE